MRGYTRGFEDACANIRKAREAGERDGSMYWRPDYPRVPFLSPIVECHLVYDAAFAKAKAQTEAELRALCDGE